MLNSNGKRSLKIGVAPTMCLIKISMKNDACKEETVLSRTVGSEEHAQRAYECGIKK